MVSSTATTRAALKLVGILLPREPAAAQTSAASPMGSCGENSKEVFDSEI